MERICIIEPLEQDTNVVAAARKQRLTLVFSSCGAEYLDDESHTTYFVLKDFDGPIFEKLKKSKARILGPTALIQLSKTDEKLSQLELRRPVYNLAMRGATICFSGYRTERDRLMLLVRLAYNMAAVVRKDMQLQTTHLIATQPGNEKYEYADTFKIPVLSDSWITAAWEKRNDVDFSASDDSVVTEHKLKLGGTRIGFLGFTPEWTEKYQDFVVKNKGAVAELGNPDAPPTHLVLNDDPMPPIPEGLPPTCYIVKCEWFWKSIENEFCHDIKDYLLQDNGINTPDGGHGMGTPGSAASRARKRKRLQLARCSGSPSMGKRRSSAHTLDFSNNILDWTLTPDKEGEKEKASPRKLKFLELYSTESNYVNILKVIVTSFKAPLDEAIEKGNPIIDAMELKNIFRNLPPILEAHSAMLEEFEAGSKEWTTTFSIGQIILKKAADLQKAYPPFINYFEKSKEALEQCEANNPRFHAFLKIRQSQAECGRQTLKELLIRPVQRLPSVSLLLSDLIKHTEKTHPDHTPLVQALDAVKVVMTYINEDKRRTEQQLAMFDLFNEIENCPPDLISSHRSMIARCECVEVIDGRSKGDPVVLLLFTDTLEICCKRRLKAFATLRGTRGLQKLTKSKQYKHLRLVPLSNVRKVVDIRDSEEARNTFALVVFNRDSMQDSTVTFMISDDSVNKTEFLETLCKQMACTLCTADPDDFLDEMDRVDIGLDSTFTSKNSTSSLTKAFKFASSAKTKMGRALSLTRTPSRASRIMPRRNQDHSAPSPALNQLAQMRLEAAVNLNDSVSSLDSALHFY